ncbi:MAG: hypothetical protein AAB414_05565 [Patescibacteria group bacterium]
MQISNPVAIALLIRAVIPGFLPVTMDFIQMFLMSPQILTLTLPICKQQVLLQEINMLAILLIKAVGKAASMYSPISVLPRQS